MICDMHRYIKLAFMYKTIKSAVDETCFSGIGFVLPSNDNNPAKQMGLI